MIWLLMIAVCVVAFVMGWLCGVAVKSEPACDIKCPEPKVYDHSREHLGRVARQAWLDWAATQPEGDKEDERYQYSWTMSYDKLSDRFKHLYGLIGERVSAEYDHVPKD